MKCFSGKKVNASVSQLQNTYNEHNAYLQKLPYANFVPIGHGRKYCK